MGLTQNWTHVVRDYGGHLPPYRYCRQCGAVWLTEDGIKSSHNAANPETPVSKGRHILSCLTCGADF